jgi:hypothetical protein
MRRIARLQKLLITIKPSRSYAAFLCEISRSYRLLPLLDRLVRICLCLVQMLLKGFARGEDVLRCCGVLAAS